MEKIYVLRIKYTIQLKLIRLFICIVPRNHKFKEKSEKYSYSRTISITTFKVLNEIYLNIDNPVLPLKKQRRSNEKLS